MKIDLDEVLPNGLTMRQQLERQSAQSGGASSVGQQSGSGSAVSELSDHSGTVMLLNASAWVVFVCAAIVIVMGISGEMFWAALIGVGVSGLIGGAALKGLAAIVSVLVEVRDGVKR